MRPFVVASLTLLLICKAPLFSWALLQGRNADTIRNERIQFNNSLYKTFDPYYSGPLLAPSAYVVPLGKINVQPYFFWIRNYGVYNSDWRSERTQSSLQFKFLNVTQIGITNFMEFSSTSQAVLNRKGDRHYFGYGDMTLNIGLQMLEGMIGTPMPALKFQVGVVLPTGKHDKLVEDRLGVDSLGAGSFGTTFSLNFSKNFNTIFHKTKDPRYYHPLRFRWSFGYLINSRTKVKGFNAYGGNQNTDGKVRVGNVFTSIFAWELSLTKHWVFATDWQYTVGSPSKFSGNTGGATVGESGKQNWSVAPALEYNFTGKLGALVGAWLSFAGRNSTGFVAGIVSVTYLF